MGSMDSRPGTETKGLLSTDVIGPPVEQSALVALKFALVTFLAAALQPREAATSLYIYSRPPLPISSPFSRHPG
jgi:hypothetical protein